MRTRPGSHQWNFHAAPAAPRPPTYRMRRPATPAARPRSRRRRRRPAPRPSRGPVRTQPVCSPLRASVKARRRCWSRFDLRRRRPVARGVVLAIVSSYCCVHERAGCTSMPVSSRSSPRGAGRASCSNSSASTRPPGAGWWVPFFFLRGLRRRRPCLGEYKDETPCCSLGHDLSVCRRLGFRGYLRRF